MFSLLTQVFWCSLLSFALGWAAGHWFKGRAAKLIHDAERRSWQTSLETVKARLERETSQKETFQKGMADISRDLTDRTAALEQSNAKVKQLQTRIVEVGAEEDSSQEIARQKAYAADLEKQLAAARRPPADEPDDLKKIHGIGPTLEKKLNGLGVTSFRKIAQWSEEDIRRFEGQFKEFRKRIERDKWVENAREEHFKKYGEQLGQNSQAAASASSF